MRYSAAALFAVRGWSTSQPRRTAMWCEQLQRHDHDDRHRERQRRRQTQHGVVRGIKHRSRSSTPGRSAMTDPPRAFACVAEHLLGRRQPLSATTGICCR
jgi:hypothetical protein